MVFNTGWTRAEVNSLTYRELFQYIEFFFKFESEKFFDFFKAFCVYNAESSAVAFGSDKSRFSKYLNEVRNRKIVFDDKQGASERIDDQFEGVKFE